MKKRILQCCARIEDHPAQRQLLLECCAGFSDWEDLRYLAEEQGMGPLLHKHLVESDVVSCPERFSRGLLLSKVRHQQLNSRLLKGLGCVLRLFETEGLQVLVLKGAALCQTLYPDISLRPMRDIDLLLSQKEAQHGHEVLQKNGFHTYSSTAPANHFHLTPLYRDIDGVQVCVELHHDLFPACPPWYHSFSFTELYTNSCCFDSGGSRAKMLSPEEMLYHLYEHGFHAPLSYEPFRLISAADVVGFVEANVDKLDWDRLKSKYPHLYRALPFFHYLTPWSDRVQGCLFPVREVIPSGTGHHFDGWPRVRMGVWKKNEVFKMLARTFYPARWWVMIYYAPVGLFSMFWCRGVKHPAHVFWWVKLYWNIFREANIPNKKTGDDAGKSRELRSMLVSSQILFRAMIKKIR